MRYACVIDYNGTQFAGWQRQNNATTVQGEIESVLTTLNGKSTLITGCGRTDAGVHASNYVFHVDVEGIVNFADQLWIHKLNQMLPPTIAFRKIIAVDSEFHSRFDAVSRHYLYRLTTKKPVFGYDHITHYKYEGSLDVSKLNQLSKLFLEATDFEAFSKLHGGNNTSFCDMTQCMWTQVNSDEYHLRISANRFLRGMVRLIVGTHLNYHRDKIKIEDIVEALSKQTRLPIIWSVEAAGLTLDRVDYPQKFVL